MNRLRQAITGLAEAAQEFDSACTEHWQTLRKQRAGQGSQFTAEAQLIDLMRVLLNNRQFTLPQARAISGAWSGWRPPTKQKTYSMPISGKSGGAA
jgi:uncharacterized protein YdiU (UPF0061 family)